MCGLSVFLLMKITLIQAPIAFLLITFFAGIPVVADDHLGARPPEGFSALFNGKDLKGWWGIGTEDPAKWMALSPEKLAEKKAKSLLDIRKHWSVENGELVNDGRGLYLSTEKHYGDFELLLEYKTVAKADSGIYLRGIPQVQIWDYTKEGGKWDIGADKGSGGQPPASTETCPVSVGYAL